MQRNSYIVLLFGVLLLLHSCATVQKSEVVVIEKKPQVSKVLTDEAPARFLKRKVAIARFSNETKYGQSFFIDENKDVIGKQAMDILSSKLAATEKFILLERADIEKINKRRKGDGLIRVERMPATSFNNRLAQRPRGKQITCIR